MSTSTRRRRTAPTSIASAIIAGVTGAALAYGTYRLVSWSLTRENDEDEDMQREGDTSGASQTLFPGQHRDSATSRRSSRQRLRLRRQRLERCRIETSKALGDLLPTLKKKMEELIDASKETNALKSLRGRNRDSMEKREEERQLWEEVMVKTFTRLIATMYAHVLLYLLLTVQVHLMGGKLLEEQLQTEQTPAMSTTDVDSLASERMGSYQVSHRIVLTHTYDYFFEVGLKILVQDVQRAVESVIGDWDPTDTSTINTSKDTIVKAVSDICQVVQGQRACRRRAQARIKSTLRFFVENDGYETTVNNEDAAAILDETWDLVESPVFDDAQRDCLQVSMELLDAKVWSKIFTDPKTVPLATIITKMKNSTASFHKKYRHIDDAVSSDSSINRFVKVFEETPTVQELGVVSFN